MVFKVGRFVNPTIWTIKQVTLRFSNILRLVETDSDGLDRGGNKVNYKVHSIFNSVTQRFSPSKQKIEYQRYRSKVCEKLAHVELYQ